MAQSAMGLGQQCGGAGSRAEDPAGASSSSLSFLRCAADAYARRPGAAVVRGSEDAAPGVAVAGKVPTDGAGRHNNRGWPDSSPDETTCSSTRGWNHVVLVYKTFALLGQVETPNFRHQV
jgi:hypothetical protein